MTPEQLSPHDPRLAAVLDLIRSAFADHEGRIDPPSSMHRMTLASLAEDAARAELWAVGTPPVASVILVPKSDKLYISKLAVHPDHRRKGLARVLLNWAADRASALGLPVLELQTRVELTENHATFHANGFNKCGETRHSGYHRTTSITMRKTL